MTSLDLPIEGMTCASCAAQVERRLNGLEGVEASVNYATERATVSFDDDRVAPQALLAAVESAGYHARLPGTEPGAVAAEPAEDPADGLRRRLEWSAALAVPVLLLAAVAPLQFDGWAWAALILATPVALWGAWPFHRAAWANLRHASATMDTLVSLGVLAAWGWSVVAVLGGREEEVYFEVAAVVTVLLLAGRSFEARAKRRAGEALESLLEISARDVAVLGDDGAERRVAIGALRPGDRFVVRPGEKVATDGVVEEGRSAVDASLLTGESVPVDVGPGDTVTGATVNAGGRLVVRATRVGADTAVAQIGRLVTAAQSGKAPVQRLADRVAGVFVPAVLVVAAATLGFWLGAGAGAGFAVTAAVSVLIIACPCALGLATPTALLVGTGRGAQLGLLIKGPEVLEQTRRVDTVLLDKTGTVTTGAMRLHYLTVADGVDRADALRLAGGLEDAAEHPVARAIALAARRETGVLPWPEDFAAREGLGATGTVEGHAVVVGRPSLLAELGMPLPPELEAARAAAQANGRTAVAAGWDGAARAVFATSDAVRLEAAEAVVRLRALGLRPVLLTGDNETTARAVASAVGIDEVIAEVLPAGKADVVAGLQAATPPRAVAMVGDGVNDAPALARADLGIAMGAGADVALEASDLTLLGEDLRGAADAIELARRTYATIRGNLFWAFAYNVAAIPLAAAGLLSPLVAGAAMALSSLFVVSNSLRLRSFGRQARSGRSG